MKRNLTEMFRIGGGLTYDGVKVELTGKKYYNTVLHYIKLTRSPINRDGGDYWESKTKLIQMELHHGSKTAQIFGKLLTVIFYRQLKSQLATLKIHPHV